MKIHMDSYDLSRNLSVNICCEVWFFSILENHVLSFQVDVLAKLC